MRRVLRTLGGAFLGLFAAMAFLIVLIIVLEAAYTRGFRYDDLTLAYFSWFVLVSAPIIGGWLGWVRS